MYSTYMSVDFLKLFTRGLPINIFHSALRLKSLGLIPLLPLSHQHRLSGLSTCPMFFPIVCAMGPSICRWSTMMMGLPWLRGFWFCQRQGKLGIHWRTSNFLSRVLQPSHGLHCPMMKQGFVLWRVARVLTLMIRRCCGQPYSWV